jgi:hypothetical protein
VEWADVPPDRGLVVAITTGHLVELLPSLRVNQPDAGRTDVRPMTIGFLRTAPGEVVRIAARVLTTASISGVAGPGAQVRLSLQELEPGNTTAIARTLSDFETLADNLGSFEIAGLKPGRKHLRSTWSVGSTHVIASRSFDLAPAEHLDLGQLLPIDTLVRCSVRFTADDGREVPVTDVLGDGRGSATLTVLRRNTNLEPTEVRRFGAQFVVSLGEPFELHGLPEGEFRVMFDHAGPAVPASTRFRIKSWRVTHDTLVVRSGSSESVEFEMLVTRR